LPACSVIVCTRYRPALLSRCLESLAGLDHSDHEVIVVDNTPGDPDTQRVASDSGAQYLMEPRVGLSRARNRGAREAGGGIIALIDDDAVADPSWLDRHQAALGDISVTATTGRILPISPESIPSELFDLDGEPFTVNRQSSWWFERANFGGLGFGGNMALRRSLFEAGFRFRESLGAGTPFEGAEEFYALHTIVRDGGSVAYVPDAVVRHDEPTDNRGPRAHDLDSARRHSAYFCLLFAEEPRLRGRLGRYLLETIRGAPRAWRESQPRARHANRARMWLAACRGPALYLRSRFAPN
jgi:glycosyltransferase involved in cell wall biosynthesis